MSLWEHIIFIALVGWISGLSYLLYKKRQTIRELNSKQDSLIDNEIKVRIRDTVREIEDAIFPIVKLELSKRVFKEAQEIRAKEIEKLIETAREAVSE